MPGDMSPRLFVPSVSSIITLLLAFDSFSRDTALAIPIPIAVPSSSIPRMAMLQSIPFSRFSRAVWSMVMGHCVYASPANTVSPMLSFSLPFMNSIATLRAACTRLGLRSSASILVETSMQSIMSIPSTLVLLHELAVCGRARAHTMAVYPAMVRTKGRCVSHTLHVRPARRKLAVELTLSEGVDFLCFSTYHTT